jgi:cell division protein FtsI (penicillin-binding protein 3)
VPLNPTPPPGQRALGPSNPLPPGANPFAYQLMGAKPPAPPAAQAETGGGLAPEPSASRGTHVRHDGIMAPVSPMMGSHMTSRDGHDDGQG